jgi:alpha-glucosidase
MGETRVPSLAQPHHDGSELYVNRLGDSAELALRAPAGAADEVLLWYARDAEPLVVEATPHESSGEIWWRAELPLRSPVVSYRWLLTGGEIGYAWLNATGMYPQQVTPIDDFRVIASPGGPDWHLESVVYEVFLDRFASSGVARELPAWAAPRAWNVPPDPHTRSPHRELYGGDLPGIEQRLDHIEALGANVLYLTPFFPATSNHRYDPTSFDYVDPVLGGDEGLASLLRAAHLRGLRVVGDLSLDHSGWQHEWFLRGQAELDSPERAFFLFDRTETNGYTGWLGYREMPRFDWRSPELRTRLGNATRRWLELGLDGWRIGAAGSVGRRLDTDLNAEIARLVRREVGDALLIAEYWNDAQPDLDGLGWHGVMSYTAFLRPVWCWLRDPLEEVFDVFTAAPAPFYGGADVARALRAFRAGGPWETSLHSWLMLDTHDTPRFSGIARSRERQLAGLGLQMTLPGVPMVFAGDEIGLPGRWGYDARRTMPWDRPELWDERLLGEYRRLIALRRSSDALARGGLRVLHADDDALLYLRESKTERVLCLAAREEHDALAVPFSEFETLYGDDVRDGVLPASAGFHAWRVDALHA